MVLVYFCPLPTLVAIETCAVLALLKHLFCKLVIALVIMNVIALVVLLNPKDSLPLDLIILVKKHFY